MVDKYFKIRRTRCDLIKSTMNTILQRDENGLVPLSPLNGVSGVFHEGKKLNERVTV